jgi:hypothetical protein
MYLVCWFIVYYSLLSTDTLPSDSVVFQVGFEVLTAVSTKMAVFWVE